VGDHCPELAQDESILINAHVARHDSGFKRNRLGTHRLARPMHRIGWIPQQSVASYISQSHLTDFEPLLYSRLPNSCFAPLRDVWAVSQPKLNRMYAWAR
jgi:hypothetical protein